LCRLEKTKDITPHRNRLPSSGIVEHRRSDLIGLDSFAIAARYGTPASYQLQSE
jgi:hypothetical protein